MDTIFVEGLGRTKDDIVIHCVREMFKARDFSAVLHTATKVIFENF